MNDIRFKNLYDAFTSHVDYANFIESYGQDNIPFDNTNFDLLQTIYAGFSLTLMMDDYFTITGKNITCKLHPEYVRSLVKMIAVDNGKGYTLGDLSYCDEYKVLEKVRNKLAHGDFIIRNGEIVFEEKNVEGRIKVDDFLKFITVFENESEKYTLGSSYRRIFNQFKHASRSNIKSEYDIDDVCNNMYRIVITDCPASLRQRNKQYYSIRDKFYSYIKMTLTKNPNVDMNQVLKEASSKLKQYGININYTVDKIKDLNYYKNVKEKYMETNHVYQDLPLDKQCNIINNLVYRMDKGQYQKFDLKKGIQLNRYILKKLKDNSKYTLMEIVSEEVSLSHMFLYHIDDAVLSSYLIGFNSLYKYGLEKGLTSKGNYSVISVLEGKSLDFSQLKLDKLYDPNMLIEHEFSNYNTEIETHERKTLDQINRLAESINQKKQQYLNNCKNVTADKIKQFDEKLTQIELLKQENMMDIAALKIDFSKFDLEKYTKNINIIIHIRNAIAHGNVFVDSYATNIKDTEIIIRDYLDGKIVYEKKLTIGDFVTLFDNVNASRIYYYLENNIRDKSLVDQNYYYNVLMRHMSSNMPEELKVKLKSR